MGTGIVSVALSLDGEETISKVLLAITTVMWVTLAALAAARVIHDRAGLRDDVRTPPALTSVAGTAVLGTGLTALGWSWAGIALLVIAACLWVALIGPVLANLEMPAVGATLLLAVATESLAELAATLAAQEHARWLLAAALAPFALGLCFYVFVIARFAVRELADGMGDHWITGGALAISTLAAGRITAGAKSLSMLGGEGGLKALTLGLWIATILWLPVLVAAEVRWPRLRYDVRRWSTVFPFGMYAACSFVVGTAAAAGAATSFARVWVWIALAMWAVVFAATLRRAIEIARTLRRPRPAPGARAPRMPRG
jgi:tellurite resistance protein TehA-like permease